MSTKCITCPPSNFPNGFVCAGKTISVISDLDALTGLPFNSNPLFFPLFIVLLLFIRFSAPGWFGLQQLYCIIRANHD
jgi:hypothetical protein